MQHTYIKVIHSFCILDVFCVIVYKSSVEMTTESAMQTVAVANDHLSTQTDSSEWMQSSDTQTSSFELSHVVGTQTDQSQWLHCEATQTAGIESHVISTQTEWAKWLHCVSVQTDGSFWQTTTSAQTDIKQLSSSAAQTKEVRVDQTFADVAIETQASLATQVTIIYCTFDHYASLVFSCVVGHYGLLALTA